MTWIFAGVFAWLVTAIGVLGLCRAAAEGDRAMRWPPLDDEEAWEQLRARLEGPTRYCPACGGWLAGDDLFDTPECQGAWLT